MTRDRTVLLAWERGYQPDHAERLSALADHLAGRGWRVVVAAKQPGAIATRPGAAALLQAPVWPIDLRLPAWNITQRDGLAPWVEGFGMADPSVVAPVLRAWRTLLDAFRPDIVIADDAPGLLLAVRGRIPLLTIGSSVKVPTAEDDDDEAAALRDRINAILTDQGLRALERLTDSQRGDRSLVFSLPGFDRFPDARTDPVCAPIGLLPPAGPAAPDAPILFHLEVPAAQNDVVIAAILRQGGACQVWCPELPDEIAQALERGGVPLIGSAAQATRAIAASPCVVHDAGPAFAFRVISARRPQLVLARDSEMIHTGTIIERRGLGQGRTLARIQLPEMLELLPALRAADWPGDGGIAAGPDWQDAIDAALAALT